MPSPEIDLRSIAASTATPGLFGAIVSLRWTPGLCWAQKLANVAAGYLISRYVGPSLSHLLGQTDPGAVSAIGFLLGLYGLNWANSIMQLPLLEMIKLWWARKTS